MYVDIIVKNIIINNEYFMRGSNLMVSNLISKNNKFLISRHINLTRCELYKMLKTLNVDFQHVT